MPVQRRLRALIVGSLLFVLACSASGIREAEQVLRNNSVWIQEAGRCFHISPRTLASVVFVEQALNVTWKDREIDPLLATYGLNVSLGLGQVKIETAQWIERELKDTASLFYLGDSVRSAFPYSNSRDNIVQRLLDPHYNSYYVAAFIAMISSRWESAGIGITDRIDILATLYSAGVVEKNVEKRKPRPNPEPNSFGLRAAEFYNSTFLRDIFSR
jgi:hypothetical protein